MTAIKEKLAEGERLLLVFTQFAYARRHVSEAGAVYLSKEETGLKSDIEFVLKDNNQGYQIDGEEIDERYPFYYYTPLKEKVLLLLAPKADRTEGTGRFVPDGQEILQIGKAYQNQFFYECFSLVNPIHAEIFFNGKEYMLRSTSESGVYLNEVVVTSQRSLQVGDRVDVYGFHMLILKDIFVCSAYVGVLRIAKESRKLHANFNTVPREPRLPLYNHRAMAETQWIERKYEEQEDLHCGELELLMPEPLRKEKRPPMFLTLGPSLTMVLPMLLMAWMGSRMTPQSGGSFYMLSIAMGMCSAVVAFFWGITNYGYRCFSERRTERQRQLQYREYLRSVREELAVQAVENRRILEKRYPPISDLLKDKSGEPQILWNRYFRDKDFLFLRVGEGSMEFQMKIKLSATQRKIVPDCLTKEAEMLAEEFEILTQVPVGVDFYNIRQIGILGNEGTALRYGVMLALIMQLLASSCYTEVKLICFYHKERAIEKNLAQCIKWMPHMWSSDGKTRYLAGDEKETAEIMPPLMRELERNKISSGQALPWYIVLVLNQELIRGELLHQYLTDSEGDYPVSAIFEGETKDVIPKGCHNHLVVENKEEMIAYEDNRIVRQEVRFETIKYKEAQEYARAVAGLGISDWEVNQQLPEKVEFLQMLGCNRVEELNCSSRWYQNNPGQRLKVPIGCGASGELVYLDIHEKFHGPHGLIAGTTGSGKSELLQTYLLSLAVNFSPEDVNFFMIDYKGGGTGDLLKSLPHCAGIISNLSGRQISRAMSAIKSENKRRQKLLSNYGVSHIDAYADLYRQKKVELPMPHLILVVDEFAELKKEEPEFMQEIISLAQVGRSLGVHLILATQKPAGTVDDRIWSNARFRLCLRVQDKQDSMDMLHNGDAALLVVPGQCYMQIGTHEYYELFQTGYCKGVYRQEGETKDSAVLIENTGKRRVLPRYQSECGAITQLEAALSYVNQTAQEEQVLLARPLWIQELPDEIVFESVEGWKDSQDKVNLLIGVCDDPENQRQFPFCYKPEEQGHLAVCGGPSTGKSTFLRTLLWQLCTGYASYEALVVAIDMGQENFGGYMTMPNCLGILQEKEEKDVFFYHLERFWKQRKKQLRESNFSGKVTSKENLIQPIFIVIDNFQACYNTLDEKQQELFYHLASEGIGCGIYFILAATAIGEIPGKVYEKIKTAFALEMSDRFQYGDILRQYYIPVLPKENTKGRGLCKVDGRILEFQTVLAPAELEISEQHEKDPNYIAHNYIEPFPHIPKRADVNTLLESYRRREDNIPLGYSLRNGRIAEFDISSNSSFLLTGIEESGMLKSFEFLFEVLQSQSTQGRKLILIDTGQRMGHLKGCEDKGKFCYVCESEAILELHKETSSKRIFLIADIGSFCNLIYSFDESHSERVNFWEKCAEGKMKDTFLMGGYSTTNDYESLGSGLIRKLIARQIGMHVGGNAAMQRVFSFEDLGYIRLNQSEPARVAYLKRGLGSRTERILLPIDKETEEDDID